MATHQLVELARLTLSTYLAGSNPEEVHVELPPELPARAAVFVSLHKGKQLCGCIGTLEPQTASLREEVMANAIAAATRDPRFAPVSLKEVPSLDISVDVLSAPEPIADSNELDPKRYGVIVVSGWRRGVLLPDLEGVNTVEEQVSIARRKAGIGPRDPIQLLRFQVRRFL
jgi:AmmeMemoRadiSam system protein A